jgi:putative transcriptional regulator
MESTLDTGGDVKHTFHMKNRVKELREQAGLSQAELAAGVGVSRQTVNSIERGRYLPSLPLAFSLARFFDTLIEEVFDAEQ